MTARKAKKEELVAAVLEKLMDHTKQRLGDWMVGALADGKRDEVWLPSGALARVPLLREMETAGLIRKRVRSMGFYGKPRYDWCITAAGHAALRARAGKE